MKGKNLAILVTAAVVLVFAAVHTSRNTDREPPRNTGKLMFPGLPINDISKIVISNGDSSLTLSKSEGKWACPDKYDFPVKFDRIIDTVRKIADLKIGQVLNVDKKQCAAIGLTPPGTASNGTLLEMYDADDTKLVSLLLGETRTGGGDAGRNFRGYPDGRFASGDMGKTACLIDENFMHITPDSKGWLKTELFHLVSPAIEKITVKGTENRPIVLEKKEDGKEFVWKDLKDDEACDAATVESLKTALDYLYFDDIADPALTDEEMGLDNPVVYSVETSRGEVYTVEIGKPPKANASKYVRLSAELMEQKPEPEADTDQELTEEEKKEAKEQKLNDEKQRKLLEEKIADMNKIFSKWTFTLAMYKTDNMTCTRDQLVSTRQPENDEKEEK